MNKQLVSIIIIFFILLTGCNGPKKMTRNRYKSYNRKQSHTQPHQHYSDKKKASKRFVSVKYFLYI